MREDYPGKAPNYTEACIVMFGVNLTWVLVAVWAVWGFLTAIFLSYLIKLGIDRLGQWRMARRAAAIRRGKND